MDQLANSPAPEKLDVVLDRARKGFSLYLFVVSGIVVAVMVFLDLQVLPNILAFIKEGSAAEAQLVKRRAYGLTVGAALSLLGTSLFSLKKGKIKRAVETEKKEPPFLKEEGGMEKIKKRRNNQLIVLEAAMTLLIGLFVVLYVANLIIPLYSVGI